MSRSIDAAVARANRIASDLVEHEMSKDPVQNRVIRDERLKLTSIAQTRGRGPGGSNLRDMTAEETYVERIEEQTAQALRVARMWGVQVRP
jgi:hypothetical protein